MVLNSHLAIHFLSISHLVLFLIRLILVVVVNGVSPAAAMSALFKSFFQNIEHLLCMIFFGLIASIRYPIIAFDDIVKHILCN